MAEKLIPYQYFREFTWEAYYPGALQVGGLMDTTQDKLVGYPSIFTPEQVLQGSVLIPGHDPVRIVITHDFARLQSSITGGKLIGFDMFSGKRGGVTGFSTWLADVPLPSSRDTTLLAATTFKAKTWGGLWERFMYNAGNGPSPLENERYLNPGHWFEIAESFWANHKKGIQLITPSDSHFMVHESPLLYRLPQGFEMITAHYYPPPVILHSREVTSTEWMLQS